MSEFDDLSGLSVDGLIRWISEKRAAQPQSRLIELIGNRAILGHRLVDVICIDLIERYRHGKPTSIEDYVADFPNLENETDLLDLVDAEICVRLELKETVSIDDYAARFPDLVSEIGQLLQLGDLASDRVSARVQGSQESACDLSFDDHSLLPTDGFQATSNLTTQNVPAVHTPPWFVGHQCIEACQGSEGKPGHWLVRGRDRVRASGLALKMIELPLFWSSSNTSMLLDACELAATVNHPAWVRPMVATIQNQILAMIRPWIFAAPNTVRSRSIEATDHQALRKHFRQFATVAFALAAAHRIGATHGAVHLENLLADQQGNLKLVDCSCGRQTISRWFEVPQAAAKPETFGFASFEQRRADDVRDLIELLATTLVEKRPGASEGLIARIRESAASDPDQSSAAIGDTLMRLADQPETFVSMVGRGNHDAWHRRALRWWGNGK